MSTKGIFIVTSAILMSYIDANCQVMSRQTFSFSYYGETLTHPGLAIDFSNNLFASSKHDIKKVRHLLQGGIGFSFYVHRRSHLGITIIPQLGYQFLLKKGFILRSHFGAGYLKQLNIGKTYEVQDDNTITAKKLAGRNKFSISLSMGFGQNLLARKTIPFGWHLDLGIFTESPTNTGWLPHLFVKTGVDYYLNFKKQ